MAQMHPQDQTLTGVVAAELEVSNSTLNTSENRISISMTQPIDFV